MTFTSSFLPPRAGDLWLVSRAATPCETRPWVEDRRRLGVPVRRLTLRRSNDKTEVPLDHPTLTNGWWDVERDGDAPWRWTNGNALLRVDGPAALLAVELRGSMTYPVDAAMPGLPRRAHA